MSKYFLVIPAEGDSVETERWYVQNLKAHYPYSWVYVFRYNGDRDINIGIRDSVRNFHEEMPAISFEIHAQGGFGAAVASYLAMHYPENVEYIFFIGGAPSTAMPKIAKFFHCWLSRLWYLSKIPFFADDPNPRHDPIISRIKRYSTKTMRKNPELYRNQLIFIGYWIPPKSWQLPYRVGFFIPNGKTVRPAWLDNSYDNKKAAELWKIHNVTTTPAPGNYFSFYSMMPTDALFKVMDSVRRPFEFD